MEENKELKFADVKNAVGEHLKTALNIEDFIITFAKREENRWRVNVEFKEKVGTVIFPTVALFTIDSKTGEITQFQKGRQWSF